MKLTVTQRLTAPISGAKYHWLHPCHGPFPQLAVYYENMEQEKCQFLVAVWAAKTTWISAVEGPDNYHAGFLRSYRWSQHECYLFCLSEKKRKVHKEINPQSPAENLLWTVADLSIILYVGSAVKKGR